METLQRTANRGSISTGFDIDNSCKFEEDNSEELNFTPSSSGSNQTWTFSCWFKLTELDKVNPIFGHYTSADNQALIRILNTNNELSFRLVNGGTVRELKSDMLFRDTSAFYHLVVAVDTTDGTSTNRVKIYVNGEQISLTGTYPTPSLVTYGINTSGINMDIGGSTTATPTFYGFTGYMAEIHHIDGSQLAPTEFGEFDDDSGIWKPKQVSGLTYGTNGFYLDFADAADLGDDESGNSNDWTEVNITAADQAVDSPTNSFAIISNAMRDNSELSYSTVSDGGSRFRTTVTEKWVTSVSSIGVTKGKWYAEFNIIGSRPNNWFGIASMEQLNNNSGYSSAGAHLGESGKNWSIGYYQANGKLDEQQNSGYTTTSSWGSSVSQNQIVGVALDMDNHKLYMSVNNTYQNSGNPVTGANAITFDATETVAIANTGYSLGSGNDTITGYNFGGYKTGGMPSQATDENGYGAFVYAPPTGYYALCTKNLAEFG